MHQLVVAYPWRHRDRAQALGTAVADVLDALPGPDLEAWCRTRRPRRGPATQPGRVRRTLRPRVPVVAVTGTNGKTTTSRMVAHIARTHGLHVGWSSTDGIYVDGELVEAGDYSGPSGAGRVLAHKQVQLAVTETARGGILLKGIGLTHNDVSVVTNVSADHLGLHGHRHPRPARRGQGVVPRITRPSGWAVLNGDDPRVFAMRLDSKAAAVGVLPRPRLAGDPRDARHDGGRATTVIDGWLSVLDAGADPTRWSRSSTSR